MNLLLNDNTTRLVVELSYWKDNRLVRSAPTREAVEAFLSVSQGKGYNFIVTADNRLYATPDTPGYCHGEKTTTSNRIISALHGLPDIASIQTFTPDQIKAMRDWAKDCQWAEDSDSDFIDELTDLQVIKGVASNYAGGLPQFIIDCEPVNTCHDNPRS